MENRNRSIIWLVIAFVVGLLAGWIILGWFVAPVEWSNAEPRDLNPVAQEQFVTTIAEAFAQTGDSAQAVARLQALGSQSDVADIASTVAAAAESNGDLVTADRVRALAAATGLTLPAAETPAGTPGAEEAQEGGGSSALLTILGLLLIAGGIALAAWLLMRRRNAPDDEDYEDEGESGAQASSPAPAASKAAAPAAAAAAATEPPGQRFRSEFSQGDVAFDESFDIEAPDGSYLGECGVTISEMVDGDPDRATALEVWLFDKSDIRTVTKVLMSDYAYGNSALRDKLSSRGEAVLLGPGLGFVLDAQTLRLAGKVVEMEYDQAVAPPSSAIRHMVVDLRVIQQPPAT